LIFGLTSALNALRSSSVPPVPSPFQSALHTTLRGTPATVGSASSSSPSLVSISHARTAKAPPFTTSFSLCVTPT